MSKTEQIAVRVPTSELADLDAAIAQGLFSSRAEALRAGLDLLLRKRRDEAIAEAYRRGYAKHPQDEWIGQVGAELAAEAIERNQGRRG